VAVFALEWADLEELRAKWGGDGGLEGKILDIRKGLDASLDGRGRAQEDSFAFLLSEGLRVELTGRLGADEDLAGLGRRLHLHGASLRELADALKLSHQRIHQIVEAAGGARRWRRRERRALELNCSFCGRAQRKSRKLVTGPGVYICESCVERAASVIVSGRSDQTTLGPLTPVRAAE